MDTAFICCAQDTAGLVASPPLQTLGDGKSLPLSLLSLSIIILIIINKNYVHVVCLNVAGIIMGQYKGDFCVVTETKTDRPYIDKINAQLGVAIGGNGYAAKSSDEIGRLAAAMMTGSWDSQIPEENFRLVLRKQHIRANL